MARYAVKTPTHHTTWDRMLEVWQAADEIDLYESAWNFDHFYPIRGDTDGPCLEAWVTVSALAQATKRIRVGTMVTGMHFRHPAVLASMASSLDIVSGGRLEIGLGAGWYDLEADAYGLDLGTVDERMTRFEEGTEVIHLLLTEEHSNFDGRFFHLSNARNEPKPIQQPRPPIVIGGRGEKRTLRLVARFASMWDALFVEDGKGRVAPAPGRVVGSLPGGWTGPGRDLLFEPSLNWPRARPSRGGNPFRGHVRCRDRRGDPRVHRGA